MPNIAPRSILLLILSVMAFPACAQEPKEQSGAALQSCLLGTPVETWQTLQLTKDQLRRMTMIQEACKEACEATGATPSKNAISQEDGSIILGEVRNVLSTAQYDAWLTYCATGETVKP